MSTVQERVVAIIAEYLGLKHEDIVLDNSLVNDLGVGSLEFVELILELEEAFGFEIPDEVAEQMDTIQEVIDYINKHHGLADASTPSSRTTKH